MEKKDILKVNSILIAFAIVLFAPIAVQADELDEPDSVYQAKKSYIESEEALKAVTNESETITDETATFEGTYDTEEEATNKQTEKEQEYSDAGYENIQSEITAITNSHEEDEELNKEYNSKEDAQTALDEFKDNHSNVTDDELVETKTDEVIETTEGTTPYNTQADAQSALDSFISKNETDDYYYTGEVTGPTGTGEYTEKEEINELFDSEDAANTYKEELEGQGYIVENDVFTPDTEERDIILDSTKYDSEDAAQAALDAFKAKYPNATWDKDATGITYVAAGTVDGEQPQAPERVTESMLLYRVENAMYVIIKKGNDFYVWTEEELDAEGIAKFKETFASLHTDHPMTGDDVAGAKFISGYDTVFGNGNKRFHFERAEDGVYLISARAANSQIMYGGYEAAPSYYITAQGTETIELESGKLTGTKKKEIQGYYYNTTKKAKKWTAKAKGKKTVTETTYYLVVKADIPQEEQKNPEKKDNSDKQKKSATKKETTKVVEAKLENPQTGDNVLKYILTLALSTIGISSLAVTNFRKRNN